MNNKTNIIGQGLYLILTGPAKGYESMTRMAVAEGIPVVQLRYKGGDTRKFLSLAHRMREITSGTDTKLIINDRVDIAFVSDADGVHLGQNDMPPKNARLLLGDSAIIGLSTHNLDQVTGALSEPVDYIGFGPVFTPFSKHNHDPVTGEEMMRVAVAKSRLPVVAIGGMNKERLQAIEDVPFHGLACIGAIEQAEDPALEMRVLQRMMEQRRGKKKD